MERIDEEALCPVLSQLCKIQLCLWSVSDFIFLTSV